VKQLAALLLVACGSSPSPAPEKATAPVAPDAAPPAIDAAPEIPAAVTAAPAWVFRFHTTDRDETWTLQFADRNALLVVATAKGTLRYVGTAEQSPDSAAERFVNLAVSTGSAKLELRCKGARRPLSAKCNDTKAKPIQVLDCFHPDFKEPMPFGPAPGIEYVAGGECTGYRTIAP
jgi:hypothetical protein